jgi:hypothetical protein
VRAEVGGVAQGGRAGDAARRVDRQPGRRPGEAVGQRVAVGVAGLDVIAERLAERDRLVGDGGERRRRVVADDQGEFLEGGQVGGVAGAVVGLDGDVERAGEGRRPGLVVRRIKGAGKRLSPPLLKTRNLV